MNHPTVLIIGIITIYGLIFDALGIPLNDQSRFRFAVSAALVAEGVHATIWQQYILPEMTVFKAKNAYGQGYPWSIPWSG